MRVPVREWLVDEPGVEIAEGGYLDDGRRTPDVKIERARRSDSAEGAPPFVVSVGDLSSFEPFVDAIEARSRAEAKMLVHCADLDFAGRGRDAVEYSIG